MIYYAWIYLRASGCVGEIRINSEFDNRLIFKSRGLDTLGYSFNTLYTFFYTSPTDRFNWYTNNKYITLNKNVTPLLQTRAHVYN